MAGLQRLPQSPLSTGPPRYLQKNAVGAIGRGNVPLSKGRYVSSNAINAATLALSFVLLPALFFVSPFLSLSPSLFSLPCFAVDRVTVTTGHTIFTLYCREPLQSSGNRRRATRSWCSKRWSTGRLLGLLPFIRTTTARTTKSSKTSFVRDQPRAKRPLS